MAYLHELEVPEDHPAAPATAQPSCERSSTAPPPGEPLKAFLLTEPDNVPAQTLYRSSGGRSPSTGPIASYWFALP
ncbi:MAG: hypothetical protein R2746_01260 [Acidimicrobiales bacterium]